MNPLVTVLVVLAVVSFLVFGSVAWAIQSGHRAVVVEASAALQTLRKLNERFRPLLVYSPVLGFDFVDRVSSKSRFDRYDLRTYFLESVASVETEARAGIDLRLVQRATFIDYSKCYDEVSVHLGASTTDPLPAEKFQRIERKLFIKGRLAEPTSTARVTCTVTYTSPQGQNSYTRGKEWDFTGLQLALDEVVRTRTSRQTTQFLRKVERNKVTAAVRARILTRDGSRCRMCGISPNEGAILHIDHIVPVSKGGLSGEANLQTLCESCNLGKSNHM